MRGGSVASYSVIDVFMSASNTVISVFEEAISGDGIEYPLSEAVLMVDKPLLEARA